MAFTYTQWILLIAFFLIFGIFLSYDLFKRSGEEKYGYFAYLIANLPANYIWVASITSGNIDTGYSGAMAVLTGLWIILVIRDIFLKDKSSGKKDADDVALMLIIGVIINMICSAVLPEVYDSIDLTQNAINYWNYFYMPGFGSSTTDLVFKSLVSILVGLILIPIIIDLKGSKVNLVALIIFTIIFMLPLWFVVYLWVPGMETGLMAVTMFLGAIIFLILLLFITRVVKDSK